MSGWLDKYHLKNYTINDDLSVDVNGGVDISHKNLKIIPVKFGNVAESFYCHNSKITTLVGAPESVGEHFDYGYNKLTSLAGSPKSVLGRFYCNNNKLTNLAGSPKIVGGGFDCSYNKLTIFAGSPDSVGWGFVCTGNSLISLNSLLELNNCNFKEKIYFNIDETNFKQKELIPILKKYYASNNKRYELTNRQFQDLIKPQIEKEILKQKLNNSKTKTKISFI